MVHKPRAYRACQLCGISLAGMSKARLYCPRCSKIAADKYERICKEHRKGNSYDYGAASREFKLWRNQEYEAALKKYPERALALKEAEAEKNVPTYPTKEAALEALQTKPQYCHRYSLKALHLPCEAVAKGLGYLPCDNCPAQAQGLLLIPPKNMGLTKDDILSYLPEI